MVASPSASSLDHDAIVQRIYDATDDPDGFESIFPDLARFFGGEASEQPRAHTIVLSQGEVVEHLHCGLDASRFDQYLSRWVGEDPRMNLATARPGLVHSDTTSLDRAAFERTPIFNEGLAVDDNYFSLFGTFLLPNGLTLAQAFMRGRRGVPYGPEEIARMTAIVPHLSRVTHLRHLLREFQRDRDDLRRALDALPTAVAIVERTGKIVCANDVAEALLRQPTGLRSQGGKLSASRPSDAAALAAALAQATCFADDRSVSARHAPPSVCIPRDGRRPLVVVLLPLRPRNVLRETEARQARALVVIQDPDRELRMNPSLVAKAHGLTATEAALAVALAGGQTLAEFASQRGSSEQTARTHLKRVFEKTGTQRQAELVRVILLGEISQLA